MNGMGSLFLSPNFSDVTFVIEEKRFHAHKVILAAHSEYFSIMLYGSLKESTEAEIVLKGTDPLAFQTLLRYIYTGQAELFSFKLNELLKILLLSHEYVLIKIMKAVASYLKTRLDIGNVFTILRTSTLLALQDLTQSCMKFCDRYADQVLTSRQNMMEMLSRDTFYASELEIFRALTRWIQAHPVVKPDSLLELLKQLISGNCLRLHLMTQKELLTFVRRSKLFAPITGELSKCVLDAMEVKDSGNGPKRHQPSEDDSIRIKSLANYKEMQSLGKGRFGEIFRTISLGTEKQVFLQFKNSVCFKMFLHLWKIRERLDVFIKEFRHLHRISLANDRIANFLGLYADEHQLLVFTEYLPNGSVKEKILNNNINENTAVHYFIEEDIDHFRRGRTASNVSFDSHVLTLAANLLLTISDSIKLANFGLVRDLAVDGFGIAVASDITLDFRGTLLYVAPEVLTSELGPGNRKAYGKPADIWALGCTLIEMLTKYPPHFEYFGYVDGIQKEILDRASGDRSSLDRFHADISGRLIPITVRPNSAGGVRRTSLPGKQKMRVRVPPGARVLIATRHPSNNLYLLYQPL
ncbi:unnamed protein product [Heligmosomoides polygyrus]|uniref:BTB domain-containing protein n=1 Tax=Heligmosomoides polygyrus TaxID=6339 RepID=A0A3P7Z7D5_HELPZ|nr:unnamed protein product [Heligmosomoides polygyrus]